MKVTECTCTGPGWCVRHQCQKSDLLYIHCQRRPDFFAAWEAGQLRELCGRHGESQRQASVCVHLGPERRRERCPTCRGHVEIKIFECALFQECVRGPSIAGLATCLICTSFVAATPVVGD